MKENARKTRHFRGKMTPLPLAVPLRTDGILAGNIAPIQSVTTPGDGRRDSQHHDPCDGKCSLPRPGQSWLRP